MPVYVLHGFRWPRDGGLTNIRVWTIMHALEDCSVDYIQNAHSTRDILSSFRTDFPGLMSQLEGLGRGLTFIEQYNPEDQTSDNAISQPFAYIADRVVEIAGSGPSTNGFTPVSATASLKDQAIKSPHTNTKSSKAPFQTSGTKGPPLSLNVEEIIAQGPGFTPAAWEAFADLRDKIAPDSKIGWFCVYNGDPERGFPASSDDEEIETSELDDLDEEEAEDSHSQASSQQTKLTTLSSSAYRPFDPRTRTAPPAALATATHYHHQHLAPEERDPPSRSSPRAQQQLSNKPSASSLRSRDIMTSRPMPALPPVPPIPQQHPHQYPSTLPSREKGKRTPGMTAAASNMDKSLPPPPPMEVPAAAERPMSSKGGRVKKKFFGGRK